MLCFGCRSVLRSALQYTYLLYPATCRPSRLSLVFRLYVTASIKFSSTKRHGRGLESGTRQGLVAFVEFTGTGPLGRSPFM